MILELVGLWLWIKIDALIVPKTNNQVKVGGNKKKTYSTSFEQKNSVGIDDGIQPVCNNEHCT